MPDTLAYPTFMSDSIGLHALHNVLCYIVQHYRRDGFSALLYRQSDTIGVALGDWDGRRYDLQTVRACPPVASVFMQQYFSKFNELLRTIRLNQAQFYFAVERGAPLLVDIQLSANKWAGPGMVRDVFGKLIPTQRVIKVEPLDARAREAIQRGAGSYAGDLILKPSRFRMCHDAVANVSRPLYVEILR